MKTQDKETSLELSFAKLAVKISTITALKMQAILCVQNFYTIDL